MPTNPTELSPGREYIKRKVVDLGKLPDPAKIEPGTQLTIGDLHGNAMKLIYFLISEGVLELKESGKTQQDLYDELYAIYNKSFDPKKITSADIARFKEIIEKAKIPESAKGALVRLIGDDLADRGNNDFLTLLVMDKLQTSSDIKFNVIFSNHGAWAVDIYGMLTSSKDYEDFKVKFEKKTGRKFNNELLVNGDFMGQLDSLHGLFNLLEKNIIDFTEVKEKFNSYKKALKLIDYSINQNGELLIYTHAPVDFSDIKILALKIGVLTEESATKFPDGFDLPEKIKVLEQINSKFANDKDALINKVDYVSGNDEDKESITAVINQFIWMRRQYSEGVEYYHAGKYTVPDGVQFVHGHDGQGLSAPGMFNLDDSQLGKIEAKTGDLPMLRTKGEYPSYELFSKQTVKDRKTEVAKVRLPLAFNTKQTLQASGYKNNCGLNCLAQYLSYLLTTGKLEEGLAAYPEYKEIYERLIENINNYYDLKDGSKLTLASLTNFLIQMNPADRDTMLAPVLRSMLYTELKDNKKLIKSRYSEYKDKNNELQKFGFIKEEIKQINKQDSPYDSKDAQEVLKIFGDKYLQYLAKLDNAAMVEQEELENLAARFGLKVMVYAPNPYSDSDVIIDYTHPAASSVGTELLPIGTFKVKNPGSIHWTAECFPGYDLKEHNNKKTNIGESNTEVGLKTTVKAYLKTLDPSKDYAQEKINLKQARVTAEGKVSEEAAAEEKKYFYDLKEVNKDVCLEIEKYVEDKSVLFQKMILNSFEKAQLETIDDFAREISSLLKELQEDKIISDDQRYTILATCTVKKLWPKEVDKEKLTSGIKEILKNADRDPMGGIAQIIPTLLADRESKNTVKPNTTTSLKIQTEKAKPIFRQIHEKVKEETCNTVSTGVNANNQIEYYDKDLGSVIVATVTQIPGYINTEFTRHAKAKHVEEIVNSVIAMDRKNTGLFNLPTITKNNTEIPGLSKIEQEQMEGILKILCANSGQYPEVKLEGFAEQDLQQLAQILKKETKQDFDINGFLKDGSKLELGRLITTCGKNPALLPQYKIPDKSLSKDDGKVILEITPALKNPKNIP